MVAPDPRSPADLRGLAAALAKHGVQVDELKVQHAGKDGTTYRFDVAAAEAVATWERIRPLADETGFYPVVCRDEHGTLVELPQLDETRPSETLRRAGALDAVVATSSTRDTGRWTSWLLRWWERSTGTSGGTDPDDA